MFRVLLVLLLAGCGGAIAPVASPNVFAVTKVNSKLSAVAPAVAAASEMSNRFKSPMATVSLTPSRAVPLMNASPPDFAPCAGSAVTVQMAAFNCLRDWQPASHPLTKLVYHFSPSVSADLRTKVKIASELSLDYSTPLLRRLRYKPTFHIFVNGEGVESVAGRAWCKQAALSYAGTATQDWLWNSPQQSGPCTNRGAGGMGNPSTIPGHATAWITKGAYGWSGGEDFWASEILPAELTHAIGLQYWDKQVPGQNTGEAMQRWVQYLGPTALQRALRIRLNGADEANLHSYLLEHHGGNRAVTWQPTFHGWLCPESDSLRAKSCGAAQDRPAAEAATPWNYTLYGYAAQYVTAKFGPAWIQKRLWPALAAEYGGGNGSYYKEMNRVAYRLWGGKWRDLEEALDTYLLAELKAEGFTGLK